MFRKERDKEKFGNGQERQKKRGREDIKESECRGKIEREEVKEKTSIKNAPLTRFLDASILSSSSVAAAAKLKRAVLFN